MRRTILGAACAAVVFGCVAILDGATAQTGDTSPDATVAKHALVIGNGRYPESPLENPAADAEDIAAALKAIGFEVKVHHDLGLAAMRLAVADFTSGLPEKAAAFFFYAGHGVQHEGRNYLGPIDAIPHIETAEGLDGHAVEVAPIVSDLMSRKTAVSVIVLDACRDFPFHAGEAHGGLARMAPASRGSDPLPSNVASSNTRTLEGTLIAYATAPNTVAFDGDGRNSPYTQELKKNLSLPNASIETILKRTRTGVTKATGGKQTPWYESSINGDFYPAGQNRIALEDLLRHLIPHKNAWPTTTADVAPWDIGSAEFSPINWVGAGIPSDGNNRAIGDFHDQFFGYAVRQGEIAITFEGQPTHESSQKTGSPAVWNVSLVKAQEGATYIASLFNAERSATFKGFGSSSVLREMPECSGGRWMDGNRVYQVVLPERIPTWLAERFWCTATGCQHEYYLLYSAQDRMRYGCPEPDRAVAATTTTHQFSENDIDVWGGWDHNGSAMIILHEDYGIYVRYVQPREGMINAGVQPGDLMMEGKSDRNGPGATISGTAYVFNERCGKTPYTVKGRFKNENHLVLTGRAPRVSASDCTVIGHRKDVLVFQRNR
jgi:hypothetical protein